MINNIFVLSGCDQLDDDNSIPWCNHAAIDNIKNVLSDQAIRVSSITAMQLSKEHVNWGDQTSIYIIPGGSAFNFGKLLHKYFDLKHKFQWAVDHGDGIIGFCAGAYFASKKWVVHVNKPGDAAPAEKYNLGLINTTAIGPFYCETYKNYLANREERWRVPKISFGNGVESDGRFEAISSLWLGGPTFEYDIGDGIDVIGSYPEGKPAVIARNKAVLSAIHPEIAASDLRNRYSNSFSCIEEKHLTLLDENDGARKQLLLSLLKRAGIE